TDPRVLDAITSPGQVRPASVDITFTNGNPRFEPYIQDIKGIRGETKITLDIDATVSRKDRSARDFAKADEWMADQLNQAQVSSPNGQPWGKASVKKWRSQNDLTWHHLEDMETMQLVPTDLNNFIAHYGGRGMLDDLLGL
ncbi:MAG: HNH endonuclease, partial [Bacteroidales bacterium]|nr:HNH endonuclease [Bacteroidales bacterium]